METNKKKLRYNIKRKSYGIGPIGRENNEKRPSKDRGSLASYLLNGGFYMTSGVTILFGKI